MKSGPDMSQSTPEREGGPRDHAHPAARRLRLIAADLWQLRRFGRLASPAAWLSGSGGAANLLV